MAENIVKLRVDSKEYESKLERARQGLQHLENELQKIGQNYTHASKEQVQYVQALGQMGTVSQTVRGKIGEMTKTFTELAVKYKQLSDEEKASPFGQALSASLDQLRTRIQDSRQQLDEVTRSLSDTKQEGGATSGIMEQLAGKFTISLDAVKLFNVGMQATQSVLSVAKDAFFNNEEQLDEWGRVVESGESIYKAFLNSINSGDISGFLSKIDSIVSAARQAYDALDELATYNAFNQVNVEKTRTGMTESIADYREGNGTKEAVRAAGDAYKKELRDRQKMEHEAYVAKIKQVAAERGVDFTDLQKALSGTYGDYRALKNVPMTGTRLSVSGPFAFGAGNVTTEKYAANERERLGEALRHLNDTELQSLQALGAQAERTGNEVAQVDKQLARVLRGNGGGGSTTTRTPRSGGGGGNTYDPLAGSIDYQAKKVQELQKAWRAAADDDSRQKIKKQIEEAQFELDKLEGKTSGIPQMNYGIGDLAGTSGSGLFQDPLFKQKTYDASNEFSSAIAHNQWRLSDDAMAAVAETANKQLEQGKKEIDTTEKLGKALSGVSTILSGIEQVGFAIPKEVKEVISVIQGLMSIVQGVQTVVTTFSTTSQAANTTAVVALTAAVTANTAALAANSVASAIPFARGGVVHAANGYVTGNRYSGDLVPAMLNSGELILNRAQQGNLVSQLNDARGVGQLEAVITGEQLRLVLNNNGRRTGRGEVVTTKFS